MTMTTASTPATVAQALAASVALGIDRLDAQLLLLHALGRAPHDRAWLLAHDTDAVSGAAWAALSVQLSRRLAGEPVAYLLGEKEFHGLDLRVDPRVLVPRPDTETLVDWALQCLQGRACCSASAMALQHARPDAQVDAVDASADALAVAKANAQRLALPVRFSQAHWLDGAASGYTVIASNPPYIAANDPHLPALRHEPAAALVAGPDGLDDIRQIVRDAPPHLADGGWLLLEHGHDQAAAVRQLLQTRGFAEVQSREDLAGIQRCSGGVWRTVK